jgi:hypothetical protein
VKICCLEKVEVFALFSLVDFKYFYKLIQILLVLHFTELQVPKKAANSFYIFDALSYISVQNYTNKSGSL